MGNRAWENIIGCLPERDPELEWYGLHDIAPLLGIQERQLRNYCRRLWPGHDPKSHWRLDHAQAARLIRAAWFGGRNSNAV